MATLLLARPSKESRGKDLKRTLLHLLHGLHSIENALRCFILPFSSHESLLATPGHPNILADFDAHVGDTACHMRAQMIWEVSEYYKPCQRRAWVDLALIALSQVKMQTISLMLALHGKRGYMRALGFGSIVTYGQIFDRIGWTAFLDILERNSTIPMFGGVASRIARARLSSSSGLSTAMPPTPADMEPIYPIGKSDYMGLLQVQDTAPMVRRVASIESFASSRSSSINRSISTFSEASVNSSSISTSLDTTAQSPRNALPASVVSGSHSYRTITADCTWDITNRLTIIRFLTLSRLLSVGKKAKVQAGFPNAAIRARTDPEFIYAQTEKEIQAFYMTAEQEVSWERLITDEDRAKKTFLVKEEEAVQVWLSNLTADWTVGLAKEVGLSQSMQRCVIVLLSSDHWLKPDFFKAAEQFDCC